MCKYLSWACFVLVMCIVDGSPPNGLTVCKINDSKCIKESSKMYKSIFAGGLPEYGVEIMDPLKIKNVNASEGNLLFLLSDVTVTGLNSCEFKKVSFDDTGLKITLKMHCSAVLDGDYILKGSVLVVPIEGDGKVHVDLNDAHFNLDIQLMIKIGEDGKKHWHVKSYQHTFDLKGKSNVVFENLFKGNEVLGRAARDLIENNSNDVIIEIGSSFIKYVIGRVVKNVKNFFRAVAIEDLSIVN